MKSLLSYFAKFFEDDAIVPKEYLDNCVVKGPDWRLIIMIIYDKSTFSTKDGRKKVWTFNG